MYKIDKLEYDTKIDITNIYMYWKEIAKEKYEEAVNLYEGGQTIDFEKFKLFKEFPNQVLPFNRALFYYRHEKFGKIFCVATQSEGDNKYLLELAIDVYKANKFYDCGAAEFESNKEGELINYDIFWKGDLGGSFDVETTDKDTLETLDALHTKIFFIFSHPIQFAISLMNCKNVDLVQHPIRVLNREIFSKEKKNETNFKLLTINRIRRILNNEGNIQMNGVKKAFHLCRGHFRQYDETNKLFGKISGRFWINMHTRGNKKYGEIKKDYRIEPPVQN